MQNEQGEAVTALNFIATVVLLKTGTGVHAAVASLRAGDANPGAIEDETNNWPTVSLRFDPVSRTSDVVDELLGGGYYDPPSGRPVATSDRHPGRLGRLRNLSDTQCAIWNVRIDLGESPRFERVSG